MNSIITEKQIKERIDLYVKKNQAEIIADIDSRVEKAVKATIKGIFQGSGYYSKKWSVIEELIDGKVQEAIELVISEVSIDKEELTRLANKKIKKQINNLEISFSDKKIGGF